MVHRRDADFGDGGLWGCLTARQTEDASRGCESADLDRAEVVNTLGEICGRSCAGREADGEYGGNGGTSKARAAGGETHDISIL